MKTGQFVELRIDRLAHGGSGVGRFEGVVVFVPFTAPGDLVRAKIQDVKKNFATADLVEILEPGPSRRDAPCPYYGSCGGCNWQHVIYAEQLAQKNSMVNFLVAKTWPRAMIDEIVPSPSEWRYRRRVQVHAENDRVGFLKRASHDMIDIKDCLITKPEVTAHFEDLRKIRNSKRKKYEIVEQHDGTVQTIDLEREPYLFMQANPEQNRKMIEFVLERLTELGPSTVIDLYCGAGNFTIPIAQKFATSEIIGVEENAHSSEDGRARGRSLKNLRIVTGDVLVFLKKQTLAQDAVIVMDPPRAGVAPEALKLIKRLRPKAIIYVSCHPATAGRDWKALEPELTLAHVRPFDMFPQTDHVELVSVLTDPTRLD